MSRDLTPKEVDMIATDDARKSIESMTLFYNGVEKPLYSEEQIEISHRYNNLGRFGFDFLMECRKLGILSSEKGKAIIKKIDDSFSGGTIEDKELYDMTIQWYEGRLVSSPDMTYNDIEFAEYVKNKIKETD